MASQTVYFDYNATTPLDPAVREAMMPFFVENFGNASSMHRLGRQARAALDESREQVACLFACKPSEIVFTSGGTESNNLAILGTARHLRGRGRHLITSMVEHHSVLNCFQYLEAREDFQVTYLPVDRDGVVRPEELLRAIRPETILVSVMAANNELGTLQPVGQLGEICRSRGIVFHTDAAQWLGKEPFYTVQQFQADLVSVCAHKLHGPKGVGALFIRSPLHLDPILLGGSHEDELRAGTENVAAIVGLAEAFVRFVRIPVFSRPHLSPLTEHLSLLLQSLHPVGVQLQSPIDSSRRLCNTVAFTTRNCDSISMLSALDMEGICASSGSACSAGSLVPSHVLLAIGNDRATANSLVRFSLGRNSTVEEIHCVEQALASILRRLRDEQLAAINR